VKANEPLRRLRKTQCRYEGKAGRVGHMRPMSLPSRGNDTSTPEERRHPPQPQLSRAEQENPEEVCH
jgi:hypothetical protein